MTTVINKRIFIYVRIGGRGEAWCSYYEVCGFLCFHVHFYNPQLYSYLLIYVIWKICETQLLTHSVSQLGFYPSRCPDTDRLCGCYNIGVYGVWILRDWILTYMRHVKKTLKIYISFLGSRNTAIQKLPLLLNANNL